MPKSTRYSNLNSLNILTTVSVNIAIKKATKIKIYTPLVIKLYTFEPSFLNLLIN